MYLKNFFGLNDIYNILIVSVIEDYVYIIDIHTVKDQKYFHNVRNSIDLCVFSCL